MNQLKVISMIAMISIIWGYLWVTIKIGLEAMPPFFFSSMRLLIGGFVLFIVLLIKRQEILPKRKEWAPFFYLSLLMCIGYYALSAYGMQFVASGISSVLVYTMPIMIGVLAHFFLGEHLTFNKVMGLIVGTIGLMFIMEPQLLHLSWNKSLVGEFIILLSAFFWACSNMYTKKIAHAHDKVKMTMWQMLMGGLLILIISLGSEQEALSKIALSKSSILALLYNGILGSAVAFVGWNWVLSKIQASIASISLMSVPLLGLFFGWLQLGEEITSNVLIGAVLICLGILFTSIQIKNKTYVKVKKTA